MIASAAASTAIPRAHWSDRILSFPVAIAAALVLLTFFTVRFRFNDPDTWWHLRVGQIILEERSIPRTDQFSHTTGNHAWIPHAWLADTFLYATYKAAGYAGLWVWLWAAASAVLVLTYLLCWKYSGDARIAFLGGMMAWFFSTVGLALRPLLLGHLFLAVELLILETARTRDRRWLWVLPPLFALWVNCHGSYTVGLIVFGVVVLCSFVGFQTGRLVSIPWAARDRKMLCAVFLLSAAALLANPEGFRLLTYPIDAMTKRAGGLSVVDEWRPVDVTDPRGLGLVMVGGVFLALFLVSSAALRLHELLWLMIAFGMALRYSRCLFQFGILAAPILCRLVAETGLRPEPRRPNRVANAVLAAICILVVVFSFPRTAQLEDQVRRGNPLKAVEFIRQARLAGPMLNDYQWGGYLIWALPEHKVFIDGRHDIFDWAGVTSQFARWATLREDPTLLLERYGIRFCLLRKGTPMAFVMPHVKGWTEVYADEQAVIFARQPK